jgi:uncharacterized protein (DUF2236 family)
MDGLHPSVIAGVQDMSNYRQDPFQRARATLGYVLTTTFGNTEAATKLIEHVKHVHSFVNGTRPDGVGYCALDPELISWVHTCIPWMIMRTFEHTNRTLAPEERDRYLAEQAIIGRMGGGDFAPTTAAELDEYVADTRPMLNVNAQTREFIDFDRPPPLTRALIEPMLQLDARRVRWAFGTPRFVQLARARASAVPARNVTAV